MWRNAKRAFHIVNWAIFQYTGNDDVNIVEGGVGATVEMNTSHLSVDLKENVHVSSYSPNLKSQRNWLMHISTCLVNSCVNNCTCVFKSSSNKGGERGNGDFTCTLSINPWIVSLFSQVPGDRNIYVDTKSNRCCNHCCTHRLSSSSSRVDCTNIISRMVLL
jgi:hypothetical protein